MLVLLLLTAALASAEVKEHPLRTWPLSMPRGMSLWYLRQWAQQPDPSKDRTGLQPPSPPFKSADSRPSVPLYNHPSMPLYNHLISPLHGQENAIGSLPSDVFSDYRSQKHDLFKRSADKSRKQKRKDRKQKKNANAEARRQRKAQAKARKQNKKNKQEARKERKMNRASMKKEKKMKRALKALFLKMGNVEGGLKSAKGPLEALIKVTAAQLEKESGSQQTDQTGLLNDFVQQFNNITLTSILMWPEASFNQTPIENHPLE